ncbi:MAG TPA: hypothetical protein VEB18_00555 [Candidatus Paceibacterota bacterium]|nr:hypothetical protein [Candidatus Paceibacterota bacterium]
MFESIRERRYLEREELRDEFYRLTPAERGDLSESEYVAKKMDAARGKDLLLVVVALVALFALGSLIP